MYRKTNIVLVCLLVVTLLLGSVHAEEQKDPKKWTIEDVLKQESAGSFDISPDGKSVVWVKSRPDKEKDRRVSDLYLTSLIDSITVQLTRGKDNDLSPKWSMDGKLIAFQSARGEGKDKKTQIWLMNPNGGEAWQLTKMKSGINSFQWRNEKEIIFAAREDPYLYEEEKKKKKDDAIVVGDQEHFVPVRLFQVTLKGKEIKRLSMNSGKIGEFAVSPDGKWIVTSEAQNIHFPYDFKIPPRQFLYHLESQSREEIFKEKMAGRFVWQLNSEGFFCSLPLSSDPDNDFVSVQTLNYFDISTQKQEKVPLDWKWELGYGYQMTQEGLFTSLANGPWNKLAFYQKKKGNWSKKSFDEQKGKNIVIHAVGKDGETVVFTYTTASTPPQIKVGKIKNAQIKKERVIISLNPWMKKKYLAKSEVITWAGAMGEKVDGILYYPYNYKKGEKYPLMGSIHGGPAGVDQDAFRESWSNYPNILSAKGSFVLKVNYHGSGNYGLKWVESIKEHYYEYEVPDILNGIDFLIEKGLVDPDQLGIMGWSNGAILAIQCVIESDRFDVVAPGAGDVNWTSDYGNCAFGAGFDNAYFGGPPWENPEYYIKKSPLFQMEKVTTPTIIFFGTEDTNVPTEQGWEHYRALQQIGKVPVRFILFPGEPHGLRRISHQRRKMEEELAWFDQYFFNTYEKSNEAFKKNSPLAMAIKLSKVKKSNGNFGELKNNVLIPEVIELDSLWVGRFEVTRAQYRSFDNTYEFEAGTGNYPVNNIIFEKAKSYCRWVSEISGTEYRLPNEKEMENLMGKAKENALNENNLDYWTGYAITPDEIKMLQDKTGNLAEGALLKPVGSFTPVGHQGIYDLGGNVAEWFLDKNGKGKISGNSAVTPSDPKTKYQPPGLIYVGFRVVQVK